MLTPIIIIVSLFIGSVTVAKKIESPEAAAEREAAVYTTEREAFDRMYENGRAISDFSRVPRQTPESLSKLGVR